MAGLLTSKEAAKLLAVSERTIRDWAAERRIECVKVGRCVRFTEAFIERFVKKNTRQALKEMER